jgi:uncharacterized membrane protein YdbT with pleckstrin-like domain
MGLFFIYLLGVLLSVVVMAWLKVNFEFFEEMVEECAPLVVFIILLWFISWPFIGTIFGIRKLWKTLIHKFEIQKSKKDLKENNDDNE